MAGFSRPVRRNSAAKTVVSTSRERHVPGAYDRTLEGTYLLALAEHPMSFKAKGPISRWQHSVGRSFSCFCRPSTSITIEFTERPASNIFVSIDADWLDERFDEAGVAASKLGDFVEHVDPVLMQIVERLQASETRYGAAAPQSQIFCDAMVQHLAGRHSAGVKDRAILPRARLRAVIEHIDANLSDALSLDALAAVAGLSRFEFARAFAAETGIPPHRYVMLKRTEAAVAMIGDDAAQLSEIAPAAGFCDQAHMTRWIAREIRVSPRRLRRIDIEGAASAALRGKTVRRKASMGSTLRKTRSRGAYA